MGAFIIFAGVIGLVCFLLGRARRFNVGLRKHPENYAVNLQTGEVIERGSKAWKLAECEGNLATTITPENGAKEGVRFK